MKIIHHLKITRQHLTTILLIGLTLTTTTQGAETTRVSVDSFGQESNGNKNNSFPSTSISADGRYVAFQSDADNLVPNDTNNHTDIFVHDRVTRKTVRIINNESHFPVISADGRYVAYWSKESNMWALYVYNIPTNKTVRRIALYESNNNILSKNITPPAISADGHLVAFSSPSKMIDNDTNNVEDVFVHDSNSRQITRISVDSTGHQSNGRSHSPAISADGRFVAFTSNANNLVPGDANQAADIFVHDRVTKQTRRVSVNNDGQEIYAFNSSSPVISADGRFVAFASFAYFDYNYNNVSDIFVYDRLALQITRVSVSSAGLESKGNSYTPAISADGRYIAFTSNAKNLVPYDYNDEPDVFVHDLITKQTTQVSVDNDGEEGANGGSYSPAISADGRYVAFLSSAYYLVPRDTNRAEDVFVHDRLLKKNVKANLKIEQTSPETVTQNNIFSYNITVTNLGPQKTDNVTVTDIAPNGITSLPTFTSSQGRCAKAPISLCRLGDLPAGQQASIQVKFKALQEGSAINRVSVNGSASDSTPNNNAVATSVKIIP